MTNNNTAQNLIKPSMLDLSHLGLIKLSGEDAFSFLQGQVTNDVNELKSNSHYSGYCSAKGRLLALFFAFSHNGDIFLQLPQELLPSIMKRLQMYVLRAKVVISDASNEWLSTGIAGELATEVLAETFSQIPDNDFQVTPHDSGILIKLPGALPRYQLVSSSESTPTLKAQLEKQCQVTNKEGWDLLEIQAGIPEVNTNTKEAFVPQMVNLDALGGINFKKGCYTGQEIVARTHYLGKVKRRTQIAHIDSAKIPQAGDAITGHDGKEAGQVVRAAPSFGQGFELLIEVRLESIEAGTLSWQDHALKLKTLPYELSE